MRRRRAFTFVYVGLRPILLSLLKVYELFCLQVNAAAGCGVAARRVASRVALAVQSAAASRISNASHMRTRDWKI